MTEVVSRVDLSSVGEGFRVGSPMVEHPINGVAQRYEQAFNRWLVRRGVIAENEIIKLDPEPHTHDYSDKGQRSDAKYYYERYMRGRYVLFSELEGVTSEHSHDEPCREWYLHVDGEAEVIIDGQMYILNAESNTILVPSEKKHQAKSKSGKPAVFVIIMENPPHNKEDLHSFKR